MLWKKKQYCHHTCAERIIHTEYSEAKRGSLDISTFCSYPVPKLARRCPVSCLLCCSAPDTPGRRKSTSVIPPNNNNCTMNVF